MTEGIQAFPMAAINRAWEQAQEALRLREV